jgi:tetratricopeptide (TPR) repeat protein
LKTSDLAGLSVLRHACGSDLAGYSRRSFLNRLAVFSAVGASLESSPLRASAVPGGCLLQTQGLLSPGLEKFLKAIEPGSDLFLCERYAADLGLIFEQWSAALRATPGDVTALANFLAPEADFVAIDRFDSRSLRNSGAIRIDTIKFHPSTHTGSAAFLEGMTAYLSGFSRIDTAEFLLTELNILEQSPVSVEITVRYDLVGARASATREERVGRWSLRCQADTHGKWQIKKWEAADETRATVTGPGFVDVTAEALHGNVAAEKQFGHGTDYWRSSIDAASGLDVYGNNGIAIGDFDGDGLDDFYVCQPSGLPNRLFRNRGDGTFEDVTDSSGLGLLDGTASALFADLTNDGTQDLIIVRTNGPLLYLNRGKGKFELKPDAFRFAKPPAGTFTAVAAADYNRDGLLDIYFCLYAYYQGLSQYTHPQPYYDAQNGPPNFLMRNRGDGTFEDVTVSSGMGENNNRYTFACGWCDYDNDGWPDLYVANDFGRKNLYHNNRDGTFHDIAKQAAVEDYGAGMSVAWFDYDNDGRQDLYVTDMYSAAGTRVTAQKVFLSGADPEVRTIYRKHASGNSLFESGPGSSAFGEASANARVRMGRWSWCADAWDFDHDGIADLYVTNGFISGMERKDLASFFWRQIVARSLDSGSLANDYQLAWNAINELIRSDYSWNGYERNVFFLNNGDRTFTEISGPLGLDFLDDSRAFALADFDGDGRLEVVLKNRTGPQLRILHNELDPIGDSITFRLRGHQSNRDAVGAAVTLEFGSSKQVKFVQAGSGFLSQHTKDLSFGLGANTGPVHATVRWPSGASQRLENIQPQHLITIEENRSDWQSKPFTQPRTARTIAANSAPAEVLPSQFECWLIEPLPAPHFSLACLDGQTRTLKSFEGNPVLLALVGGTCEASLRQLARLASSLSLFASQSIKVAALQLDSNVQAMRAFARTNPLHFPVLFADPATASIYAIFYRYLFDRRRDIETPTLLLLDANQVVFKINCGAADPAQLVRDFASAPATTDARLARALPFPGRFHAEVPHRNFFTYGIAYIQSGYVDAALECFQACIARNPNYAAAHYNMGTVYLNKQMLPEAKASLERAVALDPQDADALTNLGSVAGQQKDYDAAYRYFEQALRVRPNHSVALQNIVMLDRWKGQLERAQQSIEEAIKVDPNDAQFHFALGMLLASQDKFDAARTELERSVQLQPGDPIALNNLGVVFLRLDKSSDAFRCFDRCLRMAPDYDRPFLNIASIYQQQGQRQKAQEVLKDFLSRHPDNTDLSQALQSLSK